MKRESSTRLFCTLHEAAVFLGMPYNAVRKRYQRGTFPGVARAIDGSLWSPAGRSQVLIEAAAVRERLDERGRERFDAWQRGRLSLTSVKRQMRREQDRD
jgi:hypothetical protein